MREIILYKNMQEKIYKIVPYQVSDKEFERRSKIIEENNNRLQHIAHYKIYDDVQERNIYKYLFNIMKTIEYKYSNQCYELNWEE